jgi:hypothetical protein
MAAFNAVDTRYKVGADFDLLLRDLHGVSNRNTCAEGVSPNDEFRVVQTKPVSTNPKGMEYFDFAVAENFRLAQQIGTYQIFERVHQVTSDSAAANNSTQVIQ